MELDDMKAGWAMLARGLAINERLLRETLAAKARRALWPYLAWRAIEVVVGAWALLAISPVVAAHADDVRYLAAGGATIAFLAGTTAAAAYLVVRVAQVDLGGPVVASQRALSHVKLAEYRTTLWAIAGGVVVWLPLALLAFEAATGTPALARISLSYLVWNVAFGGVALAGAVVLARRFAGVTRGRLVDALSGRALRVAEAHLADLE